MNFTPEALWTLLLTFSVGGLGWVIRSLKEDIKEQDKKIDAQAALISNLLLQMSRDFVFSATYENNTRKLEATMLRIEQNLENKFEKIMSSLSDKMDRSEYRSYNENKF